jgi:hypothetical protein
MLWILLAGDITKKLRLEYLLKVQFDISEDRLNILLALFVFHY